jgi:hypothetical protein
MTTDLDLRQKVYDALGWNLAECADDVHIELSSGLALDALVEFCAKHHWLWQVEESPIGGYACHLRATPKRIGIPIDASGETPALAICRAIVATKERS